MKILAAMAAVMALSAPMPAHALLCVPILGCECTVTASVLDFPDFTPFAGPQDTEGSVQVHCTGVVDVAPQVSVKIGGGAWGTISDRKMQRSPGVQIGYNIFTTSARNIVWGDGIVGNAVTVSGGILTLGNWTVTRNVYGRATPNSATPPGSYTDQVVVRIDW